MDAFSIAEVDVLKILGIYFEHQLNYLELYDKISWPLVLVKDIGCNFLC